MMKLKKNFNIYTAESRVKEMKGVLRSMISGMITGRYLSKRLFLKTIKADYATTRFGVLWDFIEPLTLALIFILLRRGNVIHAGNINIPYAVFVVYGILLWQTFSEAVTSSVKIMGTHSQLLKQIKIPPEALIVSVFYKVTFNSIFRIITLLMLSIFMNSISYIGFIKFFILYPSIILLGLSIGVFLAPFNVIYSDIGRFINIILRPLLYASPVLYSIPPVAGLKYFNIINPIGIILANLRTVATQNHFPELQSFLIANISLLLVFILGWFVFHLSIPILSDKL